jgi:predicted ArsR family transcriptional regulator
MAQDRADQVDAIAALAEPTRRRLYQLVVRSAQPVGRDEAAAAAGVPRATAAFHLDRLAGEGLLDVVHQRRTGRTGPGAGRPAKLYRRTEGTVSVSLPDRRYDLAGELLAAAVEEAEHTGDRPREVLGRRARVVGEQLGRAARAGSPEREDALAAVLEEAGYEPRTEGDEVVLVNCPFHALARAHPELVCGMNVQLLDGVLEGVGEAGLDARLQPDAAHCCVRLRRR